MSKQDLYRKPGPVVRLPDNRVVPIRPPRRNWNDSPRAVPRTERNGSRDRDAA